MILAKVKRHRNFQLLYVLWTDGHPISLLVSGAHDDKWDKIQKLLCAPMTSRRFNLLDLAWE